MARKLDLSGVKTFFFAKGEKLGMAACAAAACVLVGYGVMSGMGANHAPSSKQTYPEALAANVSSLQARVRGGQPEDPAAKPAEFAFRRGWENDVKFDFQQGRLWETTDQANNKRQNPRAVAPKADPEKNQIRMDYISGAIFAWDYNQQLKKATVIKDAKPAAMPAQKGFGGFGGGAAGGNKNNGGLEPVITIQAKRMVVVQAVFPLSEQIEEFRKAFRMMHAAELFQSKDLPRFLGMNIMKTEVTPGQAPVWTPLARHNYSTGKDEVDPALLAMMREAIFDDQLLRMGAPFAFQGLVMPVPKLAKLPLQQFYPKAELEGLEGAWENIAGGEAGDGVPMGRGAAMVGGPAMGAGALPGMPGAVAGRAGADAEFDGNVPLNRLRPDLKDKFSDDFFPFDPIGFFPDPNEGKLMMVGDKGVGAILQAEGAANDPNETPKGAFHMLSPFAALSQWGRYPAPQMPAHLIPKGMQKEPGIPNFAPKQVATGKPYEALVRFIDVDVKPGKTYKYSIQVRIANPNYKKPTEVAFAALADLEELQPAPPVETPTISIPTEYFLYAIDQKPFNPKVVGGSDDKDVKPSTLPNQLQVPIQIHSWVERTVDQNGVQQVIGDWAIAERLLLRRGDIIGKTTNIEIPLWDKKIGQYTLAVPTVNEGAVPLRDKDKFRKFGKGGEMQMPPADVIAGGKGAKKKNDLDTEPAAVGVPIEFAESTPPATLVDFDGGKRTYTVHGASGATKDDSAVSLLILKADGRLIVRNQRADSDSDSADYKTRQQRIEDWKTKIGVFRGQGGAIPGLNPAGVAPDNSFLPFLRKGG